MPLNTQTNGFRNHLNLINSVTECEDWQDERALDQWSRLSGPSKEFKDGDDEVDEGSWESVTNLFSSFGESHDIGISGSVIKKIKKKLNFEAFLEPLLTLLSSGEQEVSEGVTELLGFEDMDLVMDILVNRNTVALELKEYLLKKRACDRERGAQNIEKVSISNLLSPAEARARLENALREQASRPLFTGTMTKAPEVLPHVYTSSSSGQGNILSQFGSKYMLPLGTTSRETEDYEEYIIPPAKAVPPKQTEHLVSIAELDPLAKGCFPGYSSLNRIQSIVYPTAYRSNENLLICAPTGAGKTDIAMLTILRVLDQNRTKSTGLETSIDRNAFKIIYVAPMKALASEIVRKLAKRLKWLSIEVRELTGDMQLSKTEIAETQIIVTTPEKWDVVTRKPTGEGELAMRLKLLIIDEVHLLNEERGAVLETIVARTLRQVESSQRVIRIVGLSATLPNYVDVAEFLSVSRYKGLFYFDSSFRPVPLEQHFIGIRGKTGSAQSRKNLDRATFEKVSQLVEQGHQVMVFVHARKETVKAALALKDAATADGSIDAYSCEDHPQMGVFKRKIGESRNKEMKLLFGYGFGIHHAGMLRSDRNLMEHLFLERAIKVLCCTATLAWGVNLPAHAVIIKGTEVYDSSKGSFVDLSVLDVLQIFGRAGRPGLESSGEGYICTSHDKLQHYLDAVTTQIPIESQFIKGIVDSLNAEVSLGTVTNVDEAVQWVGFTYLFVRMRKSPFYYGIARDAAAEDPLMYEKRRELVIFAARQLAEARMIIFDRIDETLTTTDLGRIAAKYYIRHASIEIFNEELKPKMTEADVLRMLCKSTEFDQIQVRESEIKELKEISENIPCDIEKKKQHPSSSHALAEGQEEKESRFTSQDKVNILLQGHISRWPVEDFALVSDSMYAAQNGGRIVRSLLEIALSLRWAGVSTVLMGISKAIEKRLWPFEQPLKQFSLKDDAIYGLERWADDWEVSDLASSSAADLGKLVHLNESHGHAILVAAKQLPVFHVTHELRPLAHDMLKVVVHLAVGFTWNSRVHGTAESFWVWIEDCENLNILQLSNIVVRQETTTAELDFIISVPTGKLPPSVTIRYISDRWIGSEDELIIPLDSLTMPASSTVHTHTLDLPLLSLNAVRNSNVERVFSSRIRGFNALQTQVLWSVLHSPLNALVCAPNGSGKSVLAHILACLYAFQLSRVLVVTPKQTITTEFWSDINFLTKNSGISVSLADETTFTSLPPKSILVVSSSQLPCLISKSNLEVELDLIICEGLEDLDSQYELAISILKNFTKSSSTRIVGFSASLSDPTDLAEWLNVDPMALHSFRPTEREQVLSLTTQTFSIPFSSSLFKSMAKPGHNAIQTAPSESAIVFVPSRGHCRSIALNLITECALKMETEKGYLPFGTSSERLEDALVRLQDTSLVDFVSRGVGFFHDGIKKPDQRLILELYAERILRVLVVPRESCWRLPVRAAVVLVMGVQYPEYVLGGPERQIRDYSLIEIVRMQSRAVHQSGSGHFFLFCHPEMRDTVTRFLEDGLPLESGLYRSEALRRWYLEGKKSGRVSNKQEGVEALALTYLAHRLRSNPAYYDAEFESIQENLSRIVDELENDGSTAGAVT